MEKKKEKLSVGRLALTIIISIILTIIIISLVNVGLSIFFKYPEYDDFCKFKTQEVIDTQERCEELGGKWNPEGKTYSREEVEPLSEDDSEIIEGYCDRNYECNKEYDSARDSFNQKRFYVFAVIGFVLLLVGLFTAEAMFQITGLATGGILVFQGVVTNWENEIPVFIALLLILVIFGIVAWRVVNRYK